MKIFNYPVKLISDIDICQLKSYKQYGKVILQDYTWYKPTIDNLKNLLEDITEDIENYGYQLWLTGRCAYDIHNANDVDLYLKGNILNIDQLENLIHYLHVIGLEKFNLLLDIKWVNELTIGYYNDDEKIAKNHSVKYIEVSYIKNVRDGETTQEFFLDRRRAAVKVTDWLVKGDFSAGATMFKPHHIHHLVKYKKFPTILAKEFIKSIS